MSHHRPAPGNPVLYWLIHLLFCLFATPVVAQEQQYIFNSFTERDGLPSKFIWKVYPDSKGFVWLGAQDGLYRHDGLEVRKIEPSPQDPAKLRNVAILDIWEASDGSFWIASVGAGLIRYDPVQGRWQQFLHQPNDPQSISGNNAVSIYEDQEGILWIGTFDNGLNRFDPETQIFTRISLADPQLSRADAFRNNSVHDFQVDIENPDILWLATPHGIGKLDRKSLKVQLFQAPDPRLEYLAIPSVAMQEKGKLMASSSGGGIIQFNTATSTWTHFVLHEQEWLKRQDHVNDFWDILPKSEHEWWVASVDAGFGILNTQTARFQFFKNATGQDLSIGSNQVRKLAKSKTGLVWISHVGTGYSVFDPSPPPVRSTTFTALPCQEKKQVNLKKAVPNQTGTKYLYIDASCSNIRIRNNGSQDLQNIPVEGLNTQHVIFSDLLRDPGGTFWLSRQMVSEGTSNGEQTLFSWKENDPSFRPYYHPILDSLGLYGNSINCLALDKKGRILVGTNHLGLFVLDPKTSSISQFANQTGWPSKEEPIITLFEDASGNVWAGTEKGTLYLWEFSKDELHKVEVQHEPQQTWLNENTAVHCFSQGKDGNIWIGTGGHGIFIIEPKRNSIQVKHLENNLPSQNIYGLSVDGQGRTWALTETNLICLLENGEQIAVFDPLDGIRQNNLWKAQLHGLEDGRMFLSTEQGTSYFFYPDDLLKNTVHTPVTFRFLKIFEENWLNNTDLNTVEKITLPFRQNFFTLGFGALDYFRPNKIKYAYRLEGYDEDWIYPSDNRTTATYTKVPPGAYTFIVKSTDHYGLWLNNERRLAITIRPPWWRTWRAWGIWIALAAAAVRVLYQFTEKRAKEQREAKRLKELDEVKNKLYGNITHEFRNPLTIQLGYLEQVRKRLAQRLPVDEELGTIKSHSHHLLDLVNQILDLRKLESGRMTAQLFQEDLISLVKFLGENFQTIAGQKGIHLDVKTQDQTLIMDLDRDKIRKILTNLLSNAIKFTPSGGRVNLELSSNPEWVHIQVKDTGIRISAKDVPYIFDRYFQASNNLQQSQGTGIGLALTKEMVQLLNGSIEVKSLEGIGTLFEVRLPRQNTAPIAVESEEQENASIPFLLTPASNTETPAPTSKIFEETILIVDDSAEIRRYLEKCLKTGFNILTAANGQEALDIALEQLPDLIITDVVMPQMDGFALLEKIKTDRRSSHIPVIMLTGRVDAESRLKGMQRGANAYLAKPFEEKLLLLTVQNLLRLKESYRLFLGTPGKPVIAQVPEGAAATEEDLKIENQFLKQVVEVIQKNLDNYQFGVEDLSRAIGMSKSQLNRKLNVLRGQSSVELINQVRLEHARIVLLETDLSISEIAYQSGFNDPNYFGRRFGQLYGMSPSEYRDRHLRQ